MDRHTDMDRIFNIDSGNGSIFTSKTLDRESLLWHNITVIATEISKSILNTNNVPVVRRQRVFKIFWKVWLGILNPNYSLLISGSVL